MRGLLAALLLGAAARADVLHVPADFATIQAAADAATSGDTILVKAGSYDEQVTLASRDGLSFRAQGKVEMTGPPTEAGFDLTSCADITVDGLRFSGLSTAVFADSCDGLVIRRCRVTDIDELGFALTGCTGLLLDRCLVDGALSFGAQIIDPIGGSVRKCTFRNVDIGLDIRGASGLLLERLVFEHISGNGIGIWLDSGCSGCIVRDSRTFETAGEALRVDGDDNRIEDVFVRSSGTFGVHCGVAAERNVLDHVRLVFGGINPIFLDGRANEARKCKVVRSFDEGLVCSGSGGHLVQGCRVVETDGQGMEVESTAQGCTLIDNRVSHAGQDGMAVDADLTTLVENQVSGSADVGILLTSTDNALIRNKVKGSAGPALIDLDGGNTYLDNVFSGEVLP